MSIIFLKHYNVSTFSASSARGLKCNVHLEWFVQHLQWMLCGVLTGGTLFRELTITKCDIWLNVRNSLPYKTLVVETVFGLCVNSRSHNNVSKLQHSICYIISKLCGEVRKSHNALIFLNHALNHSGLLRDWGERRSSLIIETFSSAQDITDISLTVWEVLLFLGYTWGRPVVWLICHFREDEQTLIQLEIGSFAGRHQLF